MVIILGLTRQEPIMIGDSNSRVRPGILLHDFNGAVRRAIIDQYVFPVLIRLLEYALNIRPERVPYYRTALLRLRKEMHPISSSCT